MPCSSCRPAPSGFPTRGYSGFQASYNSPSILLLIVSQSLMGVRKNITAEVEFKPVHKATMGLNPKGNLETRPKPYLNSRKLRCRGDLRAGDMKTASSKALPPLPCGHTLHCTASANTWDNRKSVRLARVCVCCSLMAPCQSLRGGQRRCSKQPICAPVF